MSPNIDIWTHAQWERYCQLSAATLIVYEYFLQFDNEVELFWKKRWSLGKVIFVWSRYYSLCYNVGNAIVFMNGHASQKLSVLFEYMLKLSHLSVVLGTNFFHWQNTGATLQLLTTHVILELRLYAMYRGSKFVLGLLIALVIGEAIAMGIVVGTNKPGLVGTNEPDPGLFICADGDPPGQHWIAYYWCAIFIVETTLLSLSLWKAWEHYALGGRGGIMGMLTRDSVMYFVAMFWTYLLNQVIWMMNRITLNELATGFSFTICAVLANRLMINVRASYYTNNQEFELVDVDGDANNPQVSFRREFQNGNNARSSIELESFDHRKGF